MNCRYSADRTRAAVCAFSSSDGGRLALSIGSMFFRTRPRAAESSFLRHPQDSDVPLCM
jgi:hypothetical protein